MLADDADDEGELLIRLEVPAISGLRGGGGGGGNGYTGSGGAGAEIVEAFLQRQLERKVLLPPGALTIAPGKAAWRLSLAVYCLNYDGGLADAAVLAALGALAHTQLPPASYDAKSGRVLVGTEAGAADGPQASPGGRLTLIARPVPLSFARMHERTLADPSAEEEALSEARLFVLVDESGALRAVLKPGGMPLADGELRACVDLAVARAPALLAMLDDALDAAL
ncbi:hypothetical protein T492DRAFT_930270 [Pavlovales sp. CCMP2436]|nr:hypothetical protein T492DRAFT_930270 [Pavlovales sp. CCMP2436]